MTKLPPEQFNQPEIIQTEKSDMAAYYFRFKFTFSVK